MAKIGALRERAAGERRVSVTPETVKKFIGLGAEVAVEAGAGEGASIADAAFADARGRGGNTYKIELGRRTLARALVAAARLEV